MVESETSSFAFVGERDDKKRVAAGGIKMSTPKKARQNADLIDYVWTMKALDIGRRQ